MKSPKLHRGDRARAEYVRRQHQEEALDDDNTAVVQEIGGQYFAIDPSLVDVGVPPPIIPLESWLAHWPPDLPASEAPARLSGMPKPTTPTNNRL